MAKILRVVLRVIGRDIAGLVAAGGLLLEDSLHMSLSANWLLVAVFALMESLIDEGVWAIQCRCELVLVEQGDVRFDTRALVVLVVNELDSLKIGSHGVWRSGCTCLSDCFWGSWSTRLQFAEE